ncbi:hypothetical protein CR513_05612, partial [Mucuna pruriens]
MKGDTQSSQQAAIFVSGVNIRQLHKRDCCNLCQFPLPFGNKYGFYHKVAKVKRDSNQALHPLKYHLSQAQTHMKTSADKHRQPSKIQVGDWVYLKIRPHKQSSVGKSLYPKLVVKYYRSFCCQEEWEQLHSGCSYLRQQEFTRDRFLTVVVFVGTGDNVGFWIWIGVSSAGSVGVAEFSQFK